MLKVKLNNGVWVLGKERRPGIVSALLYANRSQAKKKADEVGGQVYQPQMGPRFYVKVEEGGAS